MQMGMGTEHLPFCPHCSSKKIVANGHPHNGKRQFYCKSCNKYFSEDVLKGYPTSNIPFPVIAYILYFRRKVPEFQNMRKYRQFINHWLKRLKVTTQDVSRQTIHHWIKNYTSYLDRVITFQTARRHVQSLLAQIKKGLPPKEIPAKISYTQALKILQSKLGPEYTKQLLKEDPEFFQEFLEIITAHEVYSWEFSKKKSKRRSGSQNSTLQGVI